MSWSLLIQHGDLAVENNSLQQVTAEKKLVQDLRCHILERMGHDEIHPEFGSLIDGGVSQTIEIESVIGRVDWAYVQLEVEADLRRIIAEHQAKQLARAKDDALTYSKTTLTAGEVVINIIDFTVTQSLDNMFIHIKLQTAANNVLQLSIPFST